MPPAYWEGGAAGPAYCRLPTAIMEGMEKEGIRRQLNAIVRQRAAYRDLSNAERRAIATAAPPARMGKSLFTPGECCITKIRAMIDTPQMPTFTIASIHRLRTRLFLSPVSSVIIASSYNTFKMMSRVSG